MLCFCSFRVVSDSATPWTEALLVLLSISWCLLKLMSIVLRMMPFNISFSANPFFYLQSSPAAVFSNESAFCIIQSKYWSSSIIPFNEYSGMISFRIDWFDLLAVQETLKSLLWQHRSIASILWWFAFKVMLLFLICCLGLS